MNRIGQLVICISMLAATALVAKENPIESRIDRVTVFIQGAQIFRSAKIQLEKGKQVVILKNLSPVINHSSIQVGGTGDLTILSVSPRTNYLDIPDKEEQEQKLTDQLEQVRQEIEKLNALTTVYREEQNLILSNKSLGGQQNGVDIEQLKQAAEFFRTRLAEIETKKIELKLKTKELQDQERQFRYELNQITNARGKSTTEIWVTVDVASPTRAKFEFNYTVRNAGWQPYYDMRLESLDKPISLEYKAKVTQRTGIDWKNVSITLSSGNPNRNNVLPGILPWFIDYQRNTVRGARTESYYDMADEADAEELAETYRVASSSDRKAMKTTTSVIYQKALNFEYAISSKYTIASSNNAEDVAIRTVAIDAAFEYRANVRADKTAYLMAKLYDWNTYNLLNGSAKLFNQGTYVGETYLSVENTADTLLVSMGRDEGIVITRERVSEKTGSQSLGGNTKVSRFWTIGIRNTKQSAVRLVVTDQIPVSNQKQIQVKLEEAEGADYDENLGFLTWQLELGSSTKKELQYGYSVKYPKDEIVSLQE